MKYEEAYGSNDNPTNTFSAKVSDDIRNCGERGAPVITVAVMTVPPPAITLSVMAVPSTVLEHHLLSHGMVRPNSFLQMLLLQSLAHPARSQGKARPVALLLCSRRCLLSAAALLRSLEQQHIRLPPAILATLCLHFSLTPGWITWISSDSR